MNECQSSKNQKQRQIKYDDEKFGSSDKPPDHPYLFVEDFQL